MIEINAESVRVGGITPGDPPGFPVRITESGSYLLTSNLSLDSDDSFLEIEADHVNVEMGGHSVVGWGPGPNHGIQIRSRMNVAISNGTISNFTGWGIHDPEGHCHQIADVRLLRNIAGGALLTGSGHTIRNCVACDNMGDGFFLGDGCSVFDTHAVRNRGQGIGCGMACIVDRSVALSNVGDGVALDHGSVARGIASARNEIIGLRAVGSVITECALAYCGEGVRCSAGSVVAHSVAHRNERKSNPGGSRGNGRGFDVSASVLDASCADGNEFEGVVCSDAVISSCNITHHETDSLRATGGNMVVENRIGSSLGWFGPQDIYNHIARNWINNDEVASATAAGSYLPSTGDNANRAW